MLAAALRRLSIGWVLLGLAASPPAMAAAAAGTRPGAEDVPASGSLRRATALDRVAPYRRALWVTRWDWRTADDIARICYNAASARFSDVLFQVRGAGTVAFASKIEPWMGELTDSDQPARAVGRDPGWDPLAVAVREGHRWGLRIHAYLNVMPGWGPSGEPPAASGQLWAVHRSWFMVDRSGRRMQPAGWYSFLDPGLPEVREHLAALFGEVAAAYDLDGVHLDYIRYPSERGDYSYNPPVVAAFRRLTGAAPAAQPERWQAFRRQQIDAVVERIASAVRRARPGIEISAAVLADPQRGAQAGQQPRTWVEQGWVDAIAPMAYTDQMDRFAQLSSSFADPALRGRVWLGVWAKPDRNPRFAEQTARVATQGFGGVAVFSYGELFDAHRPTPRAVAAYRIFTGEERALDP